MRPNTRSKAKPVRKTGRRHPLATVALLAIGLGLTGGAYAAFTTTTASAETTPAVASQATVDEGQKLAQRVVRRHRLAERFLTDILGLSWAEAHHEASKWEHVMSQAVELTAELAQVCAGTRPLSSKPE